MLATLSPIEAVWILMCSTAEIVHVWNLVDILRARTWARAAADLAPGNSRAAARVMVTGQDLRHEVIRIVKQFVFIAIGVLAALTPPPLVEEVSAVASVAGGGFVFVGFLLMVDSIWDRIDRGRIRRRLSRREETP